MALPQSLSPSTRALKVKAMLPNGPFVAKYIPEYQSMVTVGRLCKGPEFSVTPVKTATVYNHTTQRGTMTANPFRSINHQWDAPWSKRLNKSPAPKVLSTTNGICCASTTRAIASNREYLKYQSFPDKELWYDRR